MKIGIDIGGSHIAIGVINQEGKIIEKAEKRLMNHDKKEIKNSLEKYIKEAVCNLQKKYKITKIGIAVPGTVNKTTIIKAVNLGIENYPMVSILQKEINLPITLRNDAKCAALAEQKLGALREYKRILFLSLGTGIGGAVIVQNELLDTGKLPGCEFGHMIMQKDGIPCKCGKKGCFEKYASMKAFKDNLRKTLGLDEKTSGEQLLNILRKREEEPEIKKIVEEFIENLSIGLSNLMNIFEPEAIGIGGSFVFFKDLLLEKLIAKLKENYLFNPREEITILPAVLGNDAGILGSIL